MSTVHGVKLRYDAEVEQHTDGCKSILSRCGMFSLMFSRGCLGVN